MYFYYWPEDDALSLKTCCQIKGKTLTNYVDWKFVFLFIMSNTTE